MDTRHDWQIAVAIYCQGAARYLEMARLTGTRATLYASIYKTGDIKQWAKEHARTQIERANEKASGLDCAVPSVAVEWSAALHGMGLSGNVRIVGTTKIE